MTRQAAELRSLLLLIADSLIDDSTQLAVDATEEDGSITLLLRVAQSDLGKVIGAQGRCERCC